LAWFRYRETVGCLILREHSRGPDTTLYSNPLSIVLPYIGAFGLGKFSVGLFAASEAGERVAPSDGGARSLWARLRALIDSTAIRGSRPRSVPSSWRCWRSLPVSMRRPHGALSRRVPGERVAGAGCAHEISLLATTPTSQGAASNHAAAAHPQAHLPLGRVLVLLIVIGTGGFYFGAAPGPTFSDAMHMTLITITTVGYGEVVPLHTVPEQVFAGMLAIADSAR